MGNPLISLVTGLYYLAKETRELPPRPRAPCKHLDILQLKLNSQVLRAVVCMLNHDFGFVHIFAIISV